MIVIHNIIDFVINITITYVFCNFVDMRDERLIETNQFYILFYAIYDLRSIVYISYKRSYRTHIPI